MSDLNSVSPSVSQIIVALITAGKVDMDNVETAIRRVQGAFFKPVSSSGGSSAPTRTAKSEDDIASDLAQRAKESSSKDEQLSGPTASGEGVHPYQKEGRKPAVDPENSVTNDHIICLDDGRKFKTLKRHLAQIGYDTPEAYLEFWGLPSDYPMVAPSYSARRSKMAKDFGFGTKNAGYANKVEKSERPDWIGADEDIVEATVKADEIICLLDRVGVKHIRSHVTRKHNMTWEDYLAKFDLPEDYPHSPYSYKRRQQEAADAHGTNVRENQAA